ncbi:hypothetical protein [Arabiibacter massiliensis]|uniref:hypothetical protein n=1 Tax=Arabiibacter massiliensis TaxID=1870985 RepID=UPI0009BB4C49|nr:hypothetical protein [Arabiibacter massiliensis]
MIGFKKIALLSCGVALTAALAGCASEAPEPQAGGEGQPAAQEQEQKQPLDLTGSWEQSNKNSEDSYHVATIEDGVITVDWVTDGGKTTSIYWVGTYEAPTEATESYAWDSVNDHEQTDGALLASSDDTKTFTYEKGVLSYELSALGTTTTVEMQKK